MYTAMVLTALCNMIYLALHVTGSSSFPQPLSKEEEQECLSRIEQGDEEAKNELIEHNLRLVAHIIKKYYASYRDQEDLISIGTIGLIKAASTFNSSKGTKFATYASRCIENEILSSRILWEAKGKISFPSEKNVCCGFCKFVNRYYYLTVNTDLMSVERLTKEILLGCEEADKGKTLDAKEVFSEFREKHS